MLVHATDPNAVKAEEKAFTHVISTLSFPVLFRMLQKLDSSPQVDIIPQTSTSPVTVMVVNLYFSNPSLVPVHGFGYLLPRSIPFQQNPERALGVIFDSDATVGQDSVPGTKITVMLGGHWWNGWTKYPDESEGAGMAKATLTRHLGITEKPQAVLVGLQRDCIPQYTVGHHRRLHLTHKMLWENFQGRLRVAGNSYTGVGINDCVRSAWDVVQGLVDGQGKTGLESFDGGQKFIWVKPADTPQ